MAINVYTDGSCYPNPNGFGGWAFVAVPDEGEEVIGSGSEEDTTNNRMEMQAVAEALEWMDAGSDVVIHSDSQYVVNTMTKGWKKGRNMDLWHRIESGVRRHASVKWEWVKAHSGHRENEMADEMAGKEREELQFLCAE